MPQEQHAANQSWTASSTEPGNGSQRARDGDCRIALTSKICGSKSARPSAVGCHTVNAIAWASGAKTRCPQVRHRSGYCSISRRRRSAKRKREARKFEKPQRLQKIVTKSWMHATEAKNGFSAGKRRHYFRFSSRSFCSSFAATISSAAFTASSKDIFVESRRTASGRRLSAGNRRGCGRARRGRAARG